MTLDIAVRTGLPSDMQTLLRDLPRDGWPDHPHFAQSTQNWMNAHRSFRQLSGFVLEDTQAFLEKAMEHQSYVGWLGHWGNLLVRNLHGHHTWEDRDFLPELSVADARFNRGLEMLETDHEALDALLDTITRQANRVVQLASLAPAQMQDEAKPLRDSAETLHGFLERHLTDEEDLVVPILLHHKLR